jgi:hypothetical protein
MLDKSEWTYMLFILFNKLFGVWQVDCRKPCPFGTGLDRVIREYRNYKIERRRK